MFSGTVQGTDRSAHVPLKKAYTRERVLHIIVNILCVGSMRFIAILDYMYAENPYYIYRTLAKEGPWAVHLTLGQDWGVG